MVIAWRYFRQNSSEWIPVRSRSSVGRIFSLVLTCLPQKSLGLILVLVHFDLLTKQTIRILTSFTVGFLLVSIRNASVLRASPLSIPCFSISFSAVARQLPQIVVHLKVPALGRRISSFPLYHTYILLEESRAIITGDGAVLCQ